MSTYKNSPRFPPDRSQVHQLQEFFPTLSIDDLQSALNDCNGDVQQAANRITEGSVEVWDSVSRKKDKKAPTLSHSHSHSGKDGFASRGRGDSRGGRGRGGARGGARGGPRGGRHSAPNGRGSPNPNMNGQSSSASGGYVSGWAEPGASNGDKAIPEEVQASATPENLEPEASGWKDETAEAETVQPSTAPSAPPTNGTINGAANSNAAKAAALAKGKSPATSKMSWAQIAKPQEKPTPPPASTHAPIQFTAPATASSAPPIPATIATHTPEHHEPAQTGWEEPTTVEAPTWDDEPAPKKLEEETPPSPEPAAEEPVPEPQLEEPAHEEPTVEAPIPEPPKAPSALPAQLHQQPQPQHAVPPAPPATTQRQFTPPVPAHTPTRGSRASKYKMLDQPVVMPSSFGQVEKLGMQFGSVSLGGENSFDQVEPPAPEPAPELEVEKSPEIPQQQAPAQQQTQPEPVPSKTQFQDHPSSSAPASIALSSSSLFQNLSQQQQIPQTSQLTPQQVHQLAQQQQAQQQAQQQIQQQHTQQVQQLTPPQPQQQATHGLTSSVSQPTLQTASASPIQQFAQQAHAVSHQSLASHHQHQHQQQQQQTHQQQQAHQQQQQHQQHQQYSQHGLSAHVDPAQSQQAQQQGAHSSYFRQAEAPYFHAPTPPAGQAQESAYGAFGGLAGQGALGGFGAGEYGYGDSQRGFYESYAQSGFGNRNILTHDDVKGLPLQQQTSSSLPPSSTQSSQQHTPAPQAGGPQSAGAVNPQQGYPAPVPYYYNPYPQNQYYGSPYNSGYGVPQPPYVKFPGMYQPGVPPGPGSAPSPAAKQPPNLQSQSNPYGQGVGLYTQQHPSASYEDIGYQQHHTQQHQQAGSLPSDGYGKQQQHQQQLYGAQAFMGLGQNAGGPASAGPGVSMGQRGGGGASPDTPYKPYAPNMGVKDVAGGQGQGQVQGRGGAQQAGHGQGAGGGGFYGGNRFGGSAGSGVQQAQGQGAQGGQQQGAPGGHAGYPQGGSEASFYSYQPRQQQGYWQ